MDQKRLLEKYQFSDRFMYIDLQQLKKLSDITSLPFQGQQRTFTIRIPEPLQKEIRSAKFTAAQTYLLVATEAISSYHNEQFAWRTSPEMKGEAFTWMLITGDEMSLQPIAA